MTVLGPDPSLKEAQEWLRGMARNGGGICPCCKRFTKIYHRAFASASARVMLSIYRRTEPDEYLFLPDLLETDESLHGTPHQGGYGTLAHHWGLMEQQEGEREDGSNRVGWWRLTLKGRGFVEGSVTVPKYATIYGGRCWGLDGDFIGIRQALGRRFDYDELMRGV